MLKNHVPPIPQSGLVHMLFPTGRATSSSVFQLISPVAYTRSDCQTVSYSVPCRCRYDTRYVKRFTSFSNAVRTCKEEEVRSSNRYAQVYISLLMDWHDNVNVCR